MLHRETILTELERRMTTVTGVFLVSRNPKKEPSVDDLPAISIFEMADTVHKTQNRGGAPVYMRGIEVIVESFIKGTSDALATKQLMAFVKEVKSKIYADPAGLGKLAHNVSESQYSRVHRPPSGEHVAGIGIALTIVYIEDTKNY